MILEHTDVLIAVKTNKEQTITPKMYKNPFPVALNMGADLE